MRRGMFGKFVDIMLMFVCLLVLYVFLCCGKFIIQKGNQDNMLFVIDFMMDDLMNVFILVLKCFKIDFFY